MLWLVPLLVLPASWFFYACVPVRKARYVLYALILASAFVLDLFNISFRGAMVDTGVRMLVCFIVAEYFWNVGRIAKGKRFKALLIVALCSYGAYHWHWIAAGPSNARGLWEPVVASTFKAEKAQYRVVDRDLFDPLHPAREIKLMRRIGSLPVEKLIKTYRTPEGYYRTRYTCKWSIQPLGIRMDLYEGDEKRWTMGEGY
jgi:hypothetical protein